MEILQCMEILRCLCLLNRLYTYMLRIYCFSIFTIKSPQANALNLEDTDKCTLNYYTLLTKFFSVNKGKTLSVFASCSFFGPYFSYM